jgi:Flp pilus assembly pilin Flp
MMNYIKSFCADESGAVTVDWVVLTASVVGIAMLTYVALADNTQAVTDATGAAVLTAQDFLTN